MNVTIWKIAIRNLFKKKAFTLISIFGLLLGFAGFLIVGLYIQYEFSWDKSHEKYERIYRVQRVMTKATHSHGGNNISPHSHVKTGYLLEEYPEFEKLTSIREVFGAFLSLNKENLIFDETGIIADHNFTSVFTYNFIEGEASEALNEPFSIALSETMAKKLFKNEKALGQNVLYEKKINLKVTGVYKDLPYNSTLRPAYLLSFITLKNTEGIERSKSWNGNCMTYALLKPGVNKEKTEQKIKSLYKDYEQLRDEELQLCLLSLVHLSFNGQKDLYAILMIFGIVGLFIVLMSAFNYINYTISNASTRSKEIAIRKLSGVNRWGLIGQFQIETIVISLVATLLSLFLVELVLPFYNSFTNAHIVIDIRNNSLFFLAYLAIAGLIGIISGIYPSILMASHNTVKLIKEKMIAKKSGGVDLKKVLVGFQFSMAVFLISLTLFFLHQVQYMINKDMGFKKENLVYTQIKLSSKNNNYQTLRSKILQHPQVVDVSFSRTLPFVNMWGSNINWEGCLPGEEILIRPNWVSYHFIENLGISLIKGRNFAPEYSSDYGNACVINKVAADIFGWDDPVGKKINNQKWTIIGVVDNYHISDMHNKIEPVVLLLAEDKLIGEWIISSRHHIGKRAEAMATLGAILNEEFPNDPFEFKDIDNAFFNEYAFKIYDTIRKSLIFFTVFVILLAIISLLGMVTYNTLQRTKEIGVRKINGSSVANIFLLLNRDFAMLIGIAFVVATPLSLLAYNNLPGNYKPEPKIWIPLLTMLLIAIVALVSTGIQTFKAARQNPVEALRYE